MHRPSYIYSGVCYVATAGQTTFALTTTAGNSIEYLKPEHIKVRTSVDDGSTWVGLTLNTDWVFADPPVSIVLNTGVAVDTLVDIHRETPMDDGYIDFQAGSLLTANDLNVFDSWQLYIDQELRDGLDTLENQSIKYLGGIDLTADQPPALPEPGDFFVNTGSGTVLPAWTGIAGETVTGSEQVIFNGVLDEWEIFKVPAGQQGVNLVTGTAPIAIDNSNPQQPDVSVTPATTSAAGSMSAADKTKLDGIDTSTGVGQWDDVTGGISYTGGSVGIGTAPRGQGALLDVNGPIQVSGVVALDNASSQILAFPNDTAALPSYGWAAQAGTGMFNPSPKNLAFSTNTIERVRIDSDGNVGIGTSNPAQLLELSSSSPRLRITDSDTVAAGATSYIEFQGSDGRTAVIYTSGGNLNIQADQSNKVIRFLTDGASNERMRIDADGNVGIGTSNPTGKLEIAGNTAEQTIKYGDGTTSGYFSSDTDVNRTGTNQAIHYHNFRWNGTSVARISSLTGNDTVNKDDGSLAFSTNSGAGLAERVRIDSSGNVGIGTSSPTQKLDLEAGSGARIAFTHTGTRRYSIGNKGAGTSSLTIRDDSGSADRFVIDSSGRVGVGEVSFSSGENFKVTSSASGATSVPGLNSLTVESNSGAGISILTPNSNIGSIAFGDPENGAIGRIRYLHSVDALSFNTNGSEQVRINSSGDLGVGATNPSYKLDVLGGAENTYIRVRPNSTDSHTAGLLFGDAGSGAPGQIKYQNTDDAMVFNTDGAERMRIRSDGVINFANCPTYADDAAAGTGGLTVGDVYKTATGELRIKL